MVRLATNVNDPVGDLLTRVRNANLAYKDDLVVPASKMNRAILTILATEGYVVGFDEEGEGIERVLRVTLKYSAKRERTITGVAAGEQARQTDLRGTGRPAACARWPGHRDRVDLAGCHDGPERLPQGDRRRGPGARVVMQR